MFYQVCRHPTESTGSWRIKLELAQMKLVHDQCPATKKSLPRMPLLALMPLDTWHMLQDFVAPGGPLLVTELSTPQWPLPTISNWIFAIVSLLKTSCQEISAQLYDTAFSSFRGKGGGQWRQKHSFKWKVPVLFLKQLILVQNVNNWKQNQWFCHIEKMFSFQFSEFGFH